MVTQVKSYKLVTIILLISLFSPLQISSSAQQDDGRSTISCVEINLEGLGPGINSIDNGSCIAIALGTLPMSTTFEIEFSAQNEPLDLLIMGEGAKLSYQNSQLYRPYLETEPTFENFSGDLKFRWTTPASSQAKEWFVVIDNMEHPFDNGIGAQGSVGINSFTLSVEEILDQWLWTEHDSIVRLDSGTNKHILDGKGGPLVLDEGSQLSITAIPAMGNPDIYLMTEEQKSNYDTLTPGVWNIDSINMKEITSEVSDAIVIPKDLSNIPLYIIVDNQENPSGGGEGVTEAALSVKVEITPVVNPIIERTIDGIVADSPYIIDAGESITLSASNTPNKRNQISNIIWDLDANNEYDDDIDLLEGPWTITIGPSYAVFGEIGTNTVGLKAVSVDGRNKTTTVDIQILDQTNPVAKIKAGNINRTVSMFGELQLESESTDNHIIEKTEWILDGNKVSEGTKYNVSTNVRGNYKVILKVTDESGNSDESEVNINVVDSTIPEFNSFMVEGFTTYGEWNNPQYQDTMQAGKNLEFTISGIDTDSGPVSYYWDFDTSTDSDGDGNSRDDIDAEGAQTSHKFSKGGVYQIGVKIVNLDGLVNIHYEYVTISDAPDPPKSKIPIILGGLGIVAVISLIATFVIKNLRLRMKQKAMIAEQLTPEEEEEIKKEEERTKLYGEQKTVESNINDAEAQKQMFSGNANTQLSALNAAENEISKIAGMGQKLQNPIIDSSLLDGLVEQQELAMNEKKEPPIQEPVEILEEKKEINAPKSQLGIELPDMETSRPLPPVKEVKFEKVRANCANCNFEFIAEMPTDSDRAMVACPSCNKDMILQR